MSGAWTGDESPSLAAGHDARKSLLNDLLHLQRRSLTELYVRIMQPSGNPSRTAHHMQILSMFRFLLRTSSCCPDFHGSHSFIVYYPGHPGRQQEACGLITRGTSGCCGWPIKPHITSLLCHRSTSQPCLNWSTTRSKTRMQSH